MLTRPKTFLHLPLAGLILVTYLLSFTLPAVDMGHPSFKWILDGKEAYGWTRGELLDQGAFIWYANPLLWVGIVILILGFWRIASGIGTVAVVLATVESVRLHSLLKFLEAVPATGKGYQVVPEAPPITPLSGSIVWYASMLLLAAAWPIGYFATKKELVEDSVQSAPQAEGPRS